jgi:hypothetical protein
MAKISFSLSVNVTVPNQFKQVLNDVYDVLQLVLYAKAMYFTKSPFFPPLFK